MIPEAPEKQDQGQEALTDALRTSFRLLRIAMAVLLLAYILSGLFVVRQHERAFVLMLGRIRGLGEERVLGPGIHWTLPSPLAEIVRVPTERVQSIESDTFWYRRPSAEEELQGTESAAGPTLDPRREGHTLSADGNLLHSRWVVRYTIADPEAWRFGLAGAEDILRKELDHAVARTSVRFTVDQALRSEIEPFRAAVDDELRGRCGRMGLGVNIERVDLLAAIPPRQVAQAFDAVVEAEQERSRRISDARGAAGRTRNEAKGEAARILSEGESYRRQLVTEAAANADYFTAVYAKYQANPDITARTLLQDTLRRALAGVDEKYIVYKSESGQQQIRLQLGPKGRKPGEAR